MRLVPVILGFLAAVAASPALSTPAHVRALLLEDRWVEALEIARELTAERPADPDAGAAFGEALMRAGRFEELEPLLDGLVDRDAPHPRAMVTLGRLRDVQGRGNESVVWMDRASAAAPDDAMVQYYAADATATREIAVARLERYLALAGGEDEDRVESAEGAIRLFRALGERPVWVDDHRPARCEIPLTPVWDSGSGVILGYTLEARVGPKNKRLKLLLDTGAAGLYVIERLAKKRGASPLSEQTSFGGGGDRRHRTRRGFFDTVTLGELRFRDALMSSSKGDLDPLGRFHGIVGLSVFNGYTVTLDLDTPRLILDPPAEEPIDGSPYWVAGGQWLVRAAVAGGTRDGLFLFDTGATGTMLSSAIVEGIDGARIRRVTEIQGIGGALQGAREIDGVDVAFQEIRVGPDDLRVIDLSLRSRMGGIEVSGFLGLDALAGTRITVDTVHRRIRVEPAP